MVRVTRLEVSLNPYFIGICWHWCNSSATDTEKAPWYRRSTRALFLRKEVKNGILLIFFDNDTQLCFFGNFYQHISIAL